MPSLFISHGAPTWALDPGRARSLLRDVAARLPRPRGLVVVSAHWVARDLRVGAAPIPATIHDFGGFPEELYRLQYPAPGDPELSTDVVRALHNAGLPARLDASRGLDHGVWVPLMHLYPEARIPVVPVSLPYDATAAEAYALGRALAPGPDRDWLVIGSGSLTHNLEEFRAAPGQRHEKWAWEFVHWARTALAQRDHSAILDYLRQAPHAAWAHPTSEHFLPLPVALGAAGPGANTEILDGGMDFGVISMESYFFS